MGKPVVPARILMTADTIGGVWTYALELARGLAPFGVEIHLATMGATPTEAQAVEARQIANLTLYPSEYRLEWMDEPWEDVKRAGDWLLELADHVQPDVVHLNGYAHSSLPWQSPTLVVAHSCVLSWWEAVKGERAPQRYYRYQSSVTSGLQQADLVVAPSQAMLNALTRHYGSFGSMRVIANGRSGAAFRPARKENFIFSAGRLWDEAKNIESLARAVTDLWWPVCLAGDQRHPSGRVPDLDRACLGVSYLGQLAPEELAGWLGRAAIYALPARYEPFGLSILEAGLSGCALVLGDIPSLREIWSGVAHFVPPDDPLALHATLNLLIANKSERRALGALARMRALQYTPERMIEGYLAAYADLLNQAKIHGDRNDAPLFDSSSA